MRPSSLSAILTKGDVEQSERLVDADPPFLAAHGDEDVAFDRAWLPLDVTSRGSSALAGERRDLVAYPVVAFVAIIA